MVASACRTALSVLASVARRRRAGMRNTACLRTQFHLFSASAKWLSGMELTVTFRGQDQTDKLGLAFLCDVEPP